MIKDAIASEINVNLSNVGGNVGLKKTTELNVIIGNAITIIMTIAVVAVLFMLLFGAFQWIISGGDKEKVASARSIITHALIGLAILGLAFVIVKTVSSIIGVDILGGNFKIPSLDN